MQNNKYIVYSFNLQYNSDSKGNIYVSELRPPNAVLRLQ